MRQKPIERIVIIRFSSFGDIVLASPLIRALRTRFPQARIDFVVKQEFAELVRSNPHLTTVYPFQKGRGLPGLIKFAQPLRRNRYNLCVDIHQNLRSHLLRSLIRPSQTTHYSKQIMQRTLLVKTGLNRYNDIVPIAERYVQSVEPFGVRNDGLGLEVFPTAEHERKVEGVFEREELRKDALAIGFGPIAAHALKQWPLEKFIRLGRELTERMNARILLFGGPADVALINEISRQIPQEPIVLAGKLSLLESAVALRRCALFIGNDSGTVHLAAAMQRPVIVLFGPTVEEFGFYPYHTEATVISLPLACRPCTHTGKGMCKIHEKQACMQRITVKQVVAAVTNML